MGLPENDAERLLIKHWEYLRFSPYFVQTALYVATPHLLEAARATIDECPEPVKFMEHLSMHFGIRTKGRPGLTRKNQVLALSPYLQLLSPRDLRDLWYVCNERGWFTIRRELFDHLLQPPFEWDYDHMASELDKMVTDKRIVWIDHWLDNLLKADISWKEILATMTIWLEKRHSLEELQVVVTAIEHRGTRKDLSVLTSLEHIPANEVRELIADTRFAVCRRNIR